MFRFALPLRAQSARIACDNPLKTNAAGALFYIASHLLAAKTVGMELTLERYGQQIHWVANLSRNAASFSAAATGTAL
jgi:hypothetical protein